MNKRLAKVILSLKSEGIFLFVKRRFSRHVVSFFLMPYYFFTLKIQSSKNLDKALDFIFKYSRDYFRPIQIKSEAIKLLELVKTKNPSVVMEIGTAFGGMLFLFSRVAREDATIISLDLPGGNFGAGYPWWKVSLYKAFASKGQNIHLVRSDSRSQETYKKVEEILNGRKIDFLFIDGDHTYQGVKEDFESYYRLMSKEGMIGFHDIIPNSFDVDIQVHQLWGEIKDKYKTQEIVEDYQQNKAGIGVIQLNL